MKKVILLSALVLALASCSTPTAPVAVTAVDSTVVAIVKSDSVKVDTAKVVVPAPVK